MSFEKIRALNNWVIKIQQNIMVICSLLISGMIFAGALMRYVFKADFYGLEELVLIFAFWLYFLGSAVASHEDSHINADLLSSFIHNAKGKNMLKAVRHFITLAITLLFTFWGYEFIMWSVKLHPKTPVFKLPLLLSQIPIFISLILMSLYSLGHLIEALGEVKYINGQEKIK